MANTQNLDLVKPLGTDHALVSVLNSNSDKIDAYAGAVNAGLDGLRDGLGILANGNTHAAITSGQFVYVKNHQTLPEGLYKATANIAANGTLSTSNLAADSAGGLNALNEQIGNIGYVYSDSTDNLEITSGTENTYFSFSVPNGTYLVSINSRGWGTSSYDRYIRVDGWPGTNQIREQGTMVKSDMTVSGAVVTNGTIDVKIYQNSGQTKTLSNVTVRCVRLFA